jgi:hypothetical protein
MYKLYWYLFYIFLIQLNIHITNCVNILEKIVNKKYWNIDDNETNLNSNTSSSSTLTFFRVTSKRYSDVNFAIDLFDNNTNTDFGKKVTVYPLDLCTNEFEKSNVIKCMGIYPEHIYNWNCIYNYCVSFSRPQAHYFYIEL